MNGMLLRARKAILLPACLALLLGLVACGGGGTEEGGEATATPGGGSATPGTGTATPAAAPSRSLCGIRRWPPIWTPSKR